MDKHLLRSVGIACILVAAAFIAGRETTSERRTARRERAAARIAQTKAPSASTTPSLPSNAAPNIAPQPQSMDEAAVSVGADAHPAPKLAMVGIDSGEDGARYASGFVIADDVVATAAHALPDPYDAAHDRITVECGGKRHAGTILYVDHGQEVLLIRAACGQPDVVVDTAPLDWSEELRFSALDFEFSEGKVSRLRSATAFTRATSFIPFAHLGRNEDRLDEPAQRVYRAIRARGLPEPVAITGAMRRGHSGGPVYRVATGGIVGFAIIYDTSYDRTFIVPASTLAAALRSAGLVQ